MIRKIDYHNLLVFLGIILLFSNSLFAQADGEFDLFVLRLKTGEVTKVTSLGSKDEYNPSFSPNSKKIVHDVVSEGSHDLYIRDLKTGVSSPLAGGEGGNDAAWSPLGRVIAFDRVPIGDLNVYVVPSRGGTPRLVVEDAIDPDWAPLGGRLVFHRPSDQGIYIVNRFGGGLRYITQGFNPVWSPSGRWIAFSDGNNIMKIAINIFGMPVGSPVALTSDGPGTFNSQPTWANNSKTIIFHSNRGGSDYDLWSVDASSGTTLQVFGFTGTNDYDPAYSNNGKYIAFAGFESAVIASPGVDTEDSQVQIEMTLQLPTEVALLKNYPNPFNPETEIKFQLPEDARVNIRIFNSLGQEVRILSDATYTAGVHSVRWNGTDNFGNQVPSGVYFYQMNSGSYNKVRKMMLVK
jgi:Tol biopolymer transport system component